MSDCPPWQDISTLCGNICACERTVDAWVKEGLLPPPRLIKRKRLWKWASVQDALRGNVYFIESSDLIKIGFTFSPKSRLKALAGSSASPIKVLLVTHGTKKYEQKLHIKFWRFRDHGEWFKKCSEITDYIDELKRLGEIPL